jgi:hypothetical protein
MTAPQPSTTSLFRLVDSKLDGTTLEEYLRAARFTDHQPFLLIAYDLTTRTGVKLTQEVVRKWIRTIEQTDGREPSVLPGHAHHSLTGFPP